MAKTKTSWAKGTSGNPRGRQPGSGRSEAYRALIESDIPDLLRLLVRMAREGDLTAMKMLVDRCWPVRDGAIADLMAEVEELRAVIAANAGKEAAS